MSLSLMPTTNTKWASLPAQRIVMFFILLLAPVYVSAAPPAIIPDRDVVLSDTSQEPEWKILWDEARELARQQKYVESARIYSRLLSLKKNLEEASWEYCLVLMTLSEWDQASILLEDLLEANPRHTDYLLTAGLVSLKKREFAKAAVFYNLVYQKKSAAILDEERPEIQEALAGLVTALNGQG
jgi:tetratricopeptide (TPR) repeat protein